MFASRERNFSANVQYGSINWGDRTAALEAFRLRWNEWYVNPMNALGQVSGAGFTEVAMGCVLIDAISQYIFNLDESVGARFRELLDMSIPDINAIQGLNIGVGTRPPLRRASDVIWSGFRCGILHEANAYMCCVVNGSGSLINVTNDLTFDNVGGSVSTIVIHPGLFRAEVERVFNEYFQSLLNQTNFYTVSFQNLNTGFFEKFRRCFGFQPW